MIATSAGVGTSPNLMAPMERSRPFIGPGLYGFRRPQREGDFVREVTQMALQDGAASKSLKSLAEQAVSSELVSVGPISLLSANLQGTLRACPSVGPRFKGLDDYSRSRSREFQRPGDLLEAQRNQEGAGQANGPTRRPGHQNLRRRAGARIGYAHSYSSMTTIRRSSGATPAEARFSPLCRWPRRRLLQPYSKAASSRLLSSLSCACRQA